MRPVEALAQIRLNVASVEQFLVAACSLADDNSEIRAQVHAAAAESRAAALLIEHLRNLFSHQQSVEGEHQPLVALGVGRIGPNAESMGQFERNAHLFTYSNRLTLVRAAKSLVASVAKILYLTDSLISVTAPTSDRHQNQLADDPANPKSLASSDRLDNVANYGQLLRSFGELSIELVNLGQCIMLSGQSTSGRCCHALGPPCPAAAAAAAVPQPRPAASTDNGQPPLVMADDDKCGGAELWPAAISNKPETHAQNMQTLFQVNRLIIDRSILLLLSASKCSLRLGAECLPGLEARRSVGAQIRASISIIMAIVKCCVFNLHGLGAATTTTTPMAANEHQPLGVDGWLAALGEPEVPLTFERANDQLGLAVASAARDRRTQHDRKPTPATGRCDGQSCGLNSAPLEIMNYFLQTWNGTPSAHDAIGRLQDLVAPFARVVDLESLVLALNETFHLHWASSEQSCAAAECCRDPSKGSCLAEDKENQVGAGEHQHQDSAASRHQQHSRPTGDAALMDKRQLVAALSSALLGEAKSSLAERVHEFTDCAYTRHEHRETIVLLLHCIKLHLNRLVKHVYRSWRRMGSMSDLNLGQLRLLASQLCDLCTELEYELQTIVIEQSDELDRCYSRLDLVKQLKHVCLIGDPTKTNRISALFCDQSEQLIEACKMLNQVAQTNKIKIVTKSLAIWFELNLNQLVNTAKCLSQNPRSKEAKDCTWAYLQVWTNFYEDFCQVARQAAYLVHAHYDAERAVRVAAVRDQLLIRRHQQQQQAATPELLAEAAGRLGQLELLTEGQQQQYFDIFSSPADLNVLESQCPPEARRVQSARSLSHAGSFRSARGLVASSDQRLHALDYEPSYLAPSDATDSPRSLDHYHGFGLNYHRHQERLATLELPPPPPPLVTQVQPIGSHHQQQRPVPLPPLFEAQQQQCGRRCAIGDAYLAEPEPSAPNPTPSFEPSSHLAYGDSALAPMAPSGYKHQAAGAMSSGDQFLLDPLANSYPEECGEKRWLKEHNAGVYASQGCYPWRNLPAQNRRTVSIAPTAPVVLNHNEQRSGRDQVFSSQPIDQQQQHHRQLHQSPTTEPLLYPDEEIYGSAMTGAAAGAVAAPPQPEPARRDQWASGARQSVSEETEQPSDKLATGNNTDQQSSTTEADKWSDSDADAIVRGARETAQMALSMYQFTRGEGSLNTTQDLFTQAELFAEEANELYKEVRCFSYKVPAGDLKKELLNELSTIPSLVQQLQLIVKNPTVGKPATFAKVDNVIRETKTLMEAVNRVVTATLSCRQHYNMAIASMRKRTRTLSPSYRGDKGFEFESHSLARQSAVGGRHSSSAGGMGSEPDI